MTLPQFIARHRPRLARELASAVSFSQDHASPWATDVEKRFADMAGGKALRGTLALIGYGGTRGALRTEAFRLGAVIELLHASLLVHDDVMDRDLLRRGRPSMFAQYARLSRNDAQHAGISLAVCAGDVGILQAMGLLARIASGSQAAADAAAIVSRCCVETGFGQMEDFALGTGIAAPDERAIMRMLIGKTARYSCSMPLAAGARLAGGSPKLVRELERLGEDLGVIFQIRDDELGLFGTTAQLGKPVGSDIRENKQTLYALYLRAAASPAELRRIKRIYGNPEAGEEDFAYVRELIVARGVQAKVARLIVRRRKAAAARIASLPFGATYRALLDDVLAFVSARTA